VPIREGERLLLRIPADHFLGNGNGDDDVNGEGIRNGKRCNAGGRQDAQRPSCIGVRQGIPQIASNREIRFASGI
jgi:hypothetical protein